MGGINIEILEVNDETFAATKTFLHEVKALTSIDDEIVRNANIIVDNNVIMGAISYEKFDSYGLIRYFVFKRLVSDNDVSMLMDRLSQKALEEGITFLFSIILDENVRELFLSLGFVEMDKNLFFVDEERINGIKYKDAQVMGKQIAIL